MRFLFLSCERSPDRLPKLCHITPPPLPAPSHKGCVVNGRMTRASNQMSTPPLPDQLVADLLIVNFVLTSSVRIPKKAQTFLVLVLVRWRFSCQTGAAHGLSKTVDGCQGVCAKRGTGWRGPKEYYRYHAAVAPSSCLLLIVNSLYEVVFFDMLV